MPARMPSELRVLGRRIKMTADKSALNTAVRGVYECHKNSITLDSGLALDEMKAVSLHEVIHDIEQCNGLNLSEQDVSSIASSLFAIIRDNPRYVAWLQEL